MQIGIISDTHSSIPQKVLQNLKNVDYIFHAGDIGDLQVLEVVKKIAPVFAVSGNIDRGSIREQVPPILFVQLIGYEICLIHDIGSPKKITYELFKKDKHPKIVIHGHTHEPSYEVFQNKIFINPGSVSFPRGRNKGSIVLAELTESKFQHRFIDII